MEQNTQNIMAQEEESAVFKWIIHGGLFSKILLALAVIILTVAVFIGINMGHYNYFTNSYSAEFNTDIALIHWLVGVYFCVTLLFFSYVAAYIERQTDFFAKILENLKKRRA